MSCGVGHRLGWDPVLLWLWPRRAATALIRPLALEPPCATSAALEKTKKKPTKKKKTLLGIPTLAPWVKNPTAVDWVAVEVWV